MRKRILSLCMALALCLGLLPTTALAADGGVSTTSVSWWDGTADTSWYTGHESDSDYTITSAAELAGLAQLVNGGDDFSGKTITLTVNNDLNPEYTYDAAAGTWTNKSSGQSGTPSHSWTPIGAVGKTFAGTFDGGDCEISGLYIYDTADQQGLFYSLAAGGTVRNLRISGAVTGGSYVGGLAGRNHGTIENCQSAVSVSGTVQAIGGLVGFNNGTISNSKNTGPVEGMMNVGGVAGYNSNNCEMNGCVNTGRITGTAMYTGGVVGMNNGGIISGGKNSGTISGETYTGGVVGHTVSVTAGTKADAVIENCNNTGSVSGTNGIGGIAGAVGNADSVVTGCYNSGAVSSTTTDSAAGGIAGYNNGMLTNCYNESANGSVITSAADGARIGGVAGANAGVLTNSYNTGAVSATGSNAAAGGVVGSNDAESGAVVSNSYYLAGAATEETDGMTGKTATQFASGEVAWLLQSAQAAGDDGNIPQVWGQTIGSDDSPIFTSSSAAKVYKASFMDDQTEYAAVYGNNGTTIAAPSDPAKAGYTFSGWEGYTENIQLTGDVTFTAVWEANSIPPIIPPTVTTYAITTPDTEHGTVAVSPSRASRGTTVTITVTPDEGYELETLSVRDSQDNEITLTDKGNGKYTFTMPAGRVTVAASFAAITPEPLPFADVDEGDWFAGAVRFVYENGMMNGTGADTFAPSGTASRAEIVTILYRLEGEPVVDDAADFDDVEDGAWYAGAVRWAASESIIGGYGNGLFGTGDPVTREQLAAILYRYTVYKGYDVSIGEDTNILSYADFADLSEYAIPAMQWACGAGIVTGTSESTLSPQGSATRAQVAAMLMRFCEYILL